MSVEYRVSKISILKHNKTNAKITKIITKITTNPTIKNNTPGDLYVSPQNK